MTLPGNMLRDNVTRLAETIAASKAVSDELKKAAMAQPVTPIPIEQEVSSEGGSGLQGAP